MGYAGRFETSPRIKVFEDSCGYRDGQNRRQGGPSAATGLDDGPDDDRQDLKSQPGDQNGDDSDEANQEREPGEEVVNFQISPARRSAGPGGEVGNGR